jgi:regulator of sigma E protease
VTATTDGFEKYSADFSNERIMVTDILPGSPAAMAGLTAGDVIETVESGKSKVESGGGLQSVGDIQNAIYTSGGKQLDLKYLRAGQSLNAEMVPVQGLVPDKYAIGIAMNEVVDMRLPFFTAIYEGAHYTGIMLEQTAVGLYSFVANIFHGTANFSDIAGPVGIAGIVGSAARMGFTYLLMITALISINLAIVNLIPFPALDGGRVLFVIIEGIIRRRISPKFTNTVNTVGFVLLMALMVIVTYKDIVRLVK